jgi:hypothetical protein
MGVGIFLWVERQLPSGSWAMVERDESRVPDWLREAREEEPDGGATHTWEIGKNYNLFAVIADHCNNRLVTGRFTEQIIAPPRGLPSDLSDGVLEDWWPLESNDAKPATHAECLRTLERRWKLGEIVAPSWVTVAELLAVDWQQATHGEGVSGESGDFLTMLHEELVPLGPPEQVRLVFFFDS